jgi:hypothetical protein
MVDDGTISPHSRPSRVGLKAVITYIAPEVSAALRHLAIDQNTSVQALGEEAYAMLLAHYGVKVKILKKEATAVRAARA